MNLKIGNTPLIKIKYKYNGKENYIYTKLESYNITGSIKDRVAYYIIKKAYDYADYLHKGQTRQSGEPYITHPLNVAYILADLQMDDATICAAILHDVVEDTEVTNEDLAKLFLFFLLIVL